MGRTQPKDFANPDISGSDKFLSESVFGCAAVVSVRAGAFALEMSALLIKYLLALATISERP